ncbi:protocadherin gamma-B7 isoform X1 [Trichechus manatus latirostris]|uniref:Protocadherin gamma-B7 isoform X1 n=1 Tax=Trichechus manatus latirostris TaxID=127582 RepID=A0A2Y9DV84_TRIMA|nr:protocadherin gamma-B7 isoform X1 [Trichechus manatus latirostris]
MLLQGRRGLQFLQLSRNAGARRELERGMGGSCAQRRSAGLRQVLFAFLLPLLCPALCEPIRYAIPEELAKGSVVGNLARDLGLSVLDVSARKLRVSAEKPHFNVDLESGDLLVKDRIDREEICRERRICELQLEAVVENPLNIFHVIVVVEDINDHAPQFRKDEINLEISESVSPGMGTILESAKDPDINMNSLNKYHLSPNEYFSLVVKDNPDGSKYPELLLQKTLDREKQSAYHLVLTALDGGDPPRSGTAQIRIHVVDANDNPPVFSQDMYRVSLREDVPPRTSVLRVRATDQDEGVNAEITYSFLNVADKAQHVFSLDSTTGDIITNQALDFEEVERYTMDVEAKDRGSLSTQCKIIIDVLDKNDNIPEIIITSLSDQILENSRPGMVVALLKTRDQDSGENGEVLCSIERDVPFKIHSSSKNYYKLVTDGALDREQTPEYNVTITATDKGKPPLSSSISLTLHVVDVNDNAPVFRQSAYVVHVPENNPPGASIAHVGASDPDLGPNGQVCYSILTSDLELGALSSYVSVSAQSGVVFAQRAFDHEQLRAFELTLQARDQGSPPLSANVSLRVLVDDRNDNAPRVLYPALGPDGSALFDTVPRAAQPGYLVTKVVAVDADSGHNAWLSYHVLQASEPGLFSLGLRTGEVRTVRALSDRDAARQRLLVAVRDGGQPPLSATATLLLVFADSLQVALPDLSDRPAPSDPQAELQFYLVVALALISVLFLLAVTLAVALRLRRSSSPTSGGCFGSVLCAKSDPGVPPNYSEGTLPYAYNLCVPEDQANPEFNFLTSVDHCPATQDSLNKNSPSVLLASILTPSVEADKTFKQQAPPNTDWRFSQAQRPGTSGSQNGDETGTWPNNQFDTEMLQAMILASASEAADGSSTLGGGAGTMGLSARYGPQFTLQHVPDYRQNVYIPGSNATLTNAAGKRDGKAPAGGNGNKKKSGKKEKK